MRLRTLTWNLMHGRAVPGAGGELFGEFAAVLAGWEWDVALLQEVPPWWPAGLSARLGCEHRMVLTSRNGLLAARRAIAVRWPDLIKSNGGGANAILARRDRIVSHGSLRLCRWPERRWVHAVQLGAGPWVANLHGSAGDERRAWRDGRLAVATAMRWAAGAPLVVGGDFNLRAPAFDGVRHIAGRDVDHLFVAGARVEGDPAVLERGRLSDHPPLMASIVID
jgi:endonuclease/exonuclease/phosphatase family metal-dependent hydrolase